MRYCCSDMCTSVLESVYSSIDHVYLLAIYLHDMVANSVTSIIFVNLFVIHEFYRTKKYSEYEK